MENDGAGSENTITPERIEFYRKRWWKLSGAEKLKEENDDTTYEKYTEQVQVVMEQNVNTKKHIDKRMEDIRQIDKDVKDGRTFAEGFQVASIVELVSESQKDKEIWVEQLTNVLQAYVYRNHRIGYTQGMNMICAWLYVFFEENELFWIFNALVEKKRAKDFYGQAPASLNGMLIEIDILKELLREEAPEFIERCGDQEVLQIMMPRWLISLYVDVVNAEVLLFIFDNMFLYGEDACQACTLAIFKCFLPKIIEEGLEGFFIYQRCIEFVQVVTLEQIKQNFNEELCKSGKIKRLRQKHRWKQSKRWERPSIQIFRQVKKATHLDEDQFRQIQIMFSNLAQEHSNGITEHMFTSIIRDLNCHITSDFCGRIFHISDLDGNGLVDPRELTVALSVLLRGTEDEKLRMCFDAFDTDHSGFLNKEEVALMTKTLKASIKEFNGRVSPLFEANMAELSAQLHLYSNKKISYEAFVNVMKEFEDITSLFTIDLEHEAIDPSVLEPYRTNTMTEDGFPGDNADAPLLGKTYPNRGEDFCCPCSLM